MIVKIIVCIIIGYAFGCFSTGYLIGKMYNLDIREHGSKSSGTTNAIRTLGVKAGILTLAGDMLKAFIPIFLIKFLVFSGDNYSQILILYTGLGAVLGHNFPLPLKFKGGKGIAVTAGVMMAFDIRIFPWVFLIFAGTILITRYVSLGSLLGATFFPIWVFMHNSKDIHVVILASLFAILAIIKHRSNIIRLIKGNENKLGQKIDIKKDE